MDLEILGYTMCRVDYDGQWAYHLEYLNCYMLDWRGGAIFLENPR